METTTTTKNNQINIDDDPKLYLQGQQNEQDSNNRNAADSTLEVTSTSMSYALDGNKIGYREPTSRPHSHYINCNGGDGIFDDRILLARRIVFGMVKISIFILIGLQAGFLAYWIRLYDLINSRMNQTFSWLVILSPFGSVYEPRDNLHLPIKHSPPYIPILGIVLNMIQIVMTVFYMYYSSCRRTFLFYMKQLLLLEGVFTIFTLIITGSLLHRNLDMLRIIMEQELSFTQQHSANLNSSESILWKNTQISTKCCGVENQSDWLSTSLIKLRSLQSLSVAKSCYYSLSAPDPDASVINTVNDQQSLANIWERGCYELEYETAFYFGKILMGMIASVFIVGLFLYLLSQKFYTLRKETRRCLGQTAQHRVFMRQGSNFITFGGQSGNSHVIRKNGILIDVKGALASSTGINDHYITLETSNFSESDSICVTREPDQISITVVNTKLAKAKVTNTKNGGKLLEAGSASGTGDLALPLSPLSYTVRGKAVITAMDEAKLETIVVTPTASGVINIIA